MRSREELQRAIETLENDIMSMMPSRASNQPEIIAINLATDALRSELSRLDETQETTEMLLRQYAFSDDPMTQDAMELKNMLRLAAEKALGIPLDELEALRKAWEEGRVIIMPKCPKCGLVNAHGNHRDCHKCGAALKEET
jgi:ribosomal protein S27AE